MFLEKIKEEEKKLEQLSETTAHRKRVVRHGKVIKKRMCAPGYRRVGNRCVRMNSQERMRRHHAAKVGDRKGKAARRRSQKRSNRIRHSRGL